MASVKSILNCIGVNTSGSVSILFHLFGFTRARVPPDPEPTATAQVSLLQLVRDLQGRHLHLNVIRVGFDTLSATDQATGDERLDYAIYRISEHLPGCVARHWTGRALRDQRCAIEWPR